MMSNLFETHAVSDGNQCFSEYQLQGMSVFFDVITVYLEEKKMDFRVYSDILEVIGASKN